jgi:anti-anti-sigma factor
VVKLSGEADITVSGKLRDTLDAEVSRQPEGSSSALSALRFMDSSALYVILAAGKTLAVRGGAMALADPQRPVSTVLRLTRADQVLAAAAIGRAARRGRITATAKRPAAGHCPGSVASVPAGE